MNRNRPDKKRQILGRIPPEDFVGRTADRDWILERVAAGHPRGLLLMVAPLTGGSELLRQTYDDLFQRRGDVVPIYYQLPATETTPVSAAIEFLNTFLLQYVAARRNEPALVRSALPLMELLDLAPASDLVWIEELIEGYRKQRFAEDDRQLIRFCLTAPRRVPATNGRPFVMLDAVHLSGYSDFEIPLGNEILGAFKSFNVPYLFSGLRREVNDVVAGGAVDFDVLKLDHLNDEETRLLFDSSAKRTAVRITDEARDLLIQQLEHRPFFLQSILQAAREKHLSLDSYLACERLYVDELLGGRLNRYFTTLFETISPKTKIRSELMRLLSEAPVATRTTSFESWQRKLGIEGEALSKIVRRFHVNELVNWDGERIEPDYGPQPWKDFIRSRFRLDALREPRALVVADLMAAALKRAPQTIEKRYRAATGLRLREVLDRFNSQRLPRVLFDYDSFARQYKGMATEQILSELEREAEFVRLPQVFHTAAGASFSRELEEFGEEACAVGHAFEGATYVDANEVVWLAGRVESKVEAEKAQVLEWISRLENLGRKMGAPNVQIWLIATEGFSSEANAVLQEHGAYGSSVQQFELVANRLTEGEKVAPAAESDEVMIVLPMGGDYEVLAANTVEQFARRLNFRPEAINQIKHAIVEACINASEHSLSPDRKIYQRFRVENDKLVITISSRGIVPANVNGQNQELRAELPAKDVEQRRGWGLKLIRTLMDEVEFERVDEGTSLRMTKYRRS